LAPAERKEQLLDLGVRLFSQLPLHEVTVERLAESAGISRGLLYHYFGGLVPFQEAIVNRAARQLVDLTDFPEIADPIERLEAGVRVYIDYVDTHYGAYLSLVRGAASGSATMAAAYSASRDAITARIIEAGAGLVADTPAHRLLVRGWQAMAQEMVLVWKERPGDVTREELLADLTASLPRLFALA
jgi:AcrR family transcriptional regulator